MGRLRYTLITTFPANGSRNVGDKLIEDSLRRLILAVNPAAEFVTFFREDDLHRQIAEINKTQAVLLPAFAIRDTPLVPHTYQLTDAFLRDLRVPLIPVGSNWNAYPGDYACRNTVQFSDETTRVLQAIASRIPRFSCREYHTCALLNRHGIDNTLMTGDPAWYDIDCIGMPLRGPSPVQRVVFTPPLSPYYCQQGIDLMEMLAGLFPQAEKICSFHLCSDVSLLNAPENSGAVSREVAEKDAAVTANATRLGFRILNAYEGLETLEGYRECDLHVGYECHAHLYFLRCRIPSLLIHEDARGTGFSYTLGGGGIDGYLRGVGVACQPVRKTITSGYCTSQEEYEIAPPSPQTVPLAKQYLGEEVENGFLRMQGIVNVIDGTFTSSMKPFLEQIL